MTAPSTSWFSSLSSSVSLCSQSSGQLEFLALAECKKFEDKKLSQLISAVYLTKIFLFSGLFTAIASLSKDVSVFYRLLCFVSAIVLILYSLASLYILVKVRFDGFSLEKVEIILDDVFFPGSSNLLQFKRKL